MHDIRPEKAGKVAELKDLLTSSKGVVLVDYCGLTVAEDTELRSKMREAGVKYMVAKTPLSVSLPRKPVSKGWMPTWNTTPLWPSPLRILWLLPRS